MDLAGSGPIHIIGGSAALTAILFIGPRLNRYKNGTKSLPMGTPMSACIGLFILWWGWIGFNTGSTYGLTAGKWSYSARAGVNTVLASMGAGAFSILYSIFRNRGQVDVFDVISGILASLGNFKEICCYFFLINFNFFLSVSINAGCFLFSSYIAILVGVLGAFFALIAIPFFNRL